MKDFIGVYEGYFSEDFCNGVIEAMQRSFDLGYGVTRQEGEDIDKTNKDDTQIYHNRILREWAVFDDSMHGEFNTAFWGDCYKQYSKEYSQLNSLAKHGVYGLKLQKTDVGQGYHMWHCEHGNEAMGRRLLAFIVYLNDVEEGGETEFLYQHKRVKPKQGTCVIFPAGFTHTHRGNPPLSDSKYIITGWVEY